MYSACITCYNLFNYVRLHVVLVLHSGIKRVAEDGVCKQGPPLEFVCHEQILGLPNSVYNNISTEYFLKRINLSPFTRDYRGKCSQRSMHQSLCPLKGSSVTFLFAF
jgi:hypothetical protein